MPAVMGPPPATGDSPRARDAARQRSTLRAGALALAVLATVLATPRAHLSILSPREAPAGSPATQSAGGTPSALRASFARGGVAISAGSMHVAVSLRSVGYGAALRPLASAAPHRRGTRVTYGHPGLSEWYDDRPGGLEQGFTVWRAPSHTPGGPLTIALKLTGARATLARDRQTALLISPSGGELRYDGLLARDARGRQLRSWLESDSGTLLLRVDARGARYPIAIDPLFQQGHKLVAGTGGGPEGSFGRSVAVSADGSTALVGAPLDHNHAGSVWALTRAGSSWAVQSELSSAELTGEPGEELCEAQTGEEGDGCGFGSSIALSADGSTALVGSPRATAPCSSSESGVCPGQGAVWVLTRTSTGWSSLPVPLTGGAEETVKGHFGRSVALSADGQVALVSAPADRAHRGAVWVFVHSGSSWVQAGEKLLASDEVGEGFFGVSLALSGDGSEALIGAPGDNGYTGAVWRFVREGSTWSQAGAKITAVAESGAAHFGRSLALSDAGDVALVGGFGDAGGAGAAWALRRSGAVWTQQKLLGAGELGEGFFGYRVALSPDGGEALVGAPYDDGKVGAAWAFSSSGSTWSIDGGKLTPRGEEGHAGFGYSLALSEGGEAALIGGPFDNRKFGAVWPFGPREAPEEEPERSREVKKRHGGEETTGQPGAGASASDPSGGVLGSGPTGGNASCALALASRKVAVGMRSRLAVRLRVGGTALCRGTLRLSVATRRVRGRARTRTIASASFALRPGALRSVTVRLNATGRALMRARHGRLNASLAIIRIAPRPVLARTSSVRLTVSTPRPHTR